MVGGFNHCKMCNKLILSGEANYCSKHCKGLDIRLYYSKIALIISLLSTLAFMTYTIVMQVPVIYIGLTLSSTMLLVFIPLYQFYQSTRIEQKLKTIYNQKTTIETKEGETLQPVYLYLYINRHTETTIKDEDYSEFI